MFATFYYNKSKTVYIEEIVQTITVYSDSEWQAAQCKWIPIDSNSDINLSHIKEYNILANILSPMKYKIP